MEKYKDKVIDIINYIERHIHDPLTLESLSAIFSISKFHMHRIFTNLTSNTLIKYIRGRKLYHSLKTLKEKNYSIIDIALMYSFGYEQSYIRSFKSAFNITPHQYRKKHIALDITARLSIEDLVLIGNGLLLPPKQIFLPELKLIGMPTQLSLKNSDYLTDPNNAGKRFVLEESKKIEGDFDPTVYYSLIRYINFEKGLYEYTPSFTYSKIDSNPPSLKTIRINSSEYIIFKYFGNHSPYQIDMNILSDCYAYINNNYLEYLKEKSAPPDKMERIDDSLCCDDYCELDLLYKLK